MSQALVKVQEALEEAHRDSPRSGKWSTVTEVKSYESDANLLKLRKLVQDGAAKEKLVKGTPTKLFKPTRAGAGVTGLGDKDGDKDRGKGPREPRRGGKKPGKPRRTGKKPGRGGKPDQKKPSKPRRDSKEPPKPRSSGNVANVIGAGVTTMLIGGLGSSSGGGSIAGPRGGTVGYISGPM